MIMAYSMPRKGTCAADDGGNTQVRLMVGAVKRGTEWEEGGCRMGWLHPG